MNTTRPRNDGAPHLIEQLHGQLIVSCQDYVETMLPAAVQGGASALRLNGPLDVRFARSHCNIPILACNKVFFPNSDIYITPSVRTAAALTTAGADMVAFDARALPRPRQTVIEIVNEVHSRNRLAVADVGTIDEGLKARDDGADIVATTFAGGFNPHLIHTLTQAGCTVLAEGGIDSPETVSEAISAGAWAVCVGSSITRPHLITTAFRKGLALPT